MKIHKCDLCGRDFDDLDEQENFGFHYNHIGYGSHYDGCSINIDFCCDCFDRLMQNYVEPNLKFKKNAIKDYD